MSEIIKFPNNNERLRLSAEMIGFEALSIVTEKYGTGNIQDEVTQHSENLAYHNMEHTLSVRRDSKLVAQALELDDFDVSIVELAASAHDIVQLKERGIMEQESADWLEYEMIAANFSSDDIIAAKLAILGTEPLTSQDGMIVGQRVNLLQFPSERAANIALSIACGDMAGLCTPRGVITGRGIYKELRGIGPEGQPKIDGLLAFQRVQLDLLRNYQFPHPAGEELFGKFRQEVIDYQMWITQQLWLGVITTWEQVIEQDEAFYNMYRAV